jgi:hypothetical protein
MIEEQVSIQVLKPVNGDFAGLGILNADQAINHQSLITAKRNGKGVFKSEIELGLRGDLDLLALG